jgi:hypothetical protein
MTVNMDMLPMANLKDCRYYGLPRAQTHMLTWGVITSSMQCILTKGISMHQMLYSKDMNLTFRCCRGECVLCKQTSRRILSQVETHTFHYTCKNRFTAASQHQDQSYFSLKGSKNVILDWVKKAEDSSGLIVRLYEAYGGRSVVKLRSILPIKKVERSNFLEDKTKSYLDIDSDGDIELSLDAFELVTLKLYLKPWGIQ